MDAWTVLSLPQRGPEVGFDDLIAWVSTVEPDVKVSLEDAPIVLDGVGRNLKKETETKDHTNS